MRTLRLLPLLLVLACGSPPVAGARPEINADFRKPDVDVERWVGTLESESREIAAQRAAITAAIGLRAGQAVADIGAGTGLFEEPFAEAVGPTGVVYAVDISQAFVDHIRERAAAAGLSQVQPVLCDDRSTGLPRGSVDVAFVCDTYHHFEHPNDTLASLHDALRPGGRLVVVDFERVEGQSRDWVLQHVRCGREQVIAEIEGAGFHFARTLPVAGLSENYVIEFVRG
ncbi:MAG TPA: class I SAM-dependent methyltransferase [Planctomycetota bacterium]|nr:class I SAM-dependent methyltransferase [Planctomycetota bacterium]